MPFKITPPSTTPLWLRLSQKLVEDILSGKYPVGSKLPTEHDLISEHELSRHTVRSALADVESRGLISRKQHIGSIVISNRITSSFTHELQSIGSIDRETATHNRTLIGYEPSICNKGLAAATGFPLKTPLMRLDYLRRSPVTGVLLSYTHAWVKNTGDNLITLAESNPNTPLADLLEGSGHLLCSHIEQRFTVTACPGMAATYLGLQTGQPVLLIERRYLDNRRVPVAVSKNYFPQDRYTYTESYSRQASAD